MSNDLAARPTRPHEIVPQTHPELLGAQDTCGHGMGGVWFPVSQQLQSRPSSPSAANETAVDPDNRSLLAPSEDAGPVLWRARFEPDIVKDLVSFNDPSGQVTDSDLELAATIVQHDIAAHHCDVRERTMSGGSDNTPAVAWQGKGSTTTASAPAHLLQRHGRRRLPLVRPV
jgi:hypothetical protein